MSNNSVKIFNVGIEFTIDFTNGIKVGGGLGLGYEISLNINWYELFH